MEEYLIGFVISLAATLVGLAIDYLILKPRSRHRGSDEHDIEPGDESPQPGRVGNYLRGLFSRFHWPRSRRTNTGSGKLSRIGAYLGNLLFRMFTWSPSGGISGAYTFVILLIVGGSAGAGAAFIAAIDSEDLLPILIIPAIIGGAVLAGYFDRLLDLEYEPFLWRVPIAGFWGLAGGFLTPIILCGGLVFLFIYFKIIGSNRPSSPYFFDSTPKFDSRQRTYGNLFGCPQCDNPDSYFLWPIKWDTRFVNGRFISKMVRVCPKCGYKHES